MTKKNENPNPTLRKGQEIELPIHLSTGTLMIPCVIIDQRVMFGRKEWLVEPVHGTGAGWVTEDKLLTGEGPVHRSKGWQSQTKTTTTGGEG